MIAPEIPYLPRIVLLAAQVWSVDQSEVLGRRRLGDLMAARHAVRNVLYILGWRQQEIAHHTGCNHKSVDSSRKAVQSLCLCCPEFGKRWGDFTHLVAEECFPTRSEVVSGPSARLALPVSDFISAVKQLAEHCAALTSQVERLLAAQTGTTNPT